MSCAQNNSGIKKGVFELYENDSLIGMIYRSGQYQIEYYGVENETIVKIEHSSASEYYLTEVESNFSDIDSIDIASFVHKKISSDQYQIKGRGLNIISDYRYYATLKKISEEIPEKYAKKLDSLNKK
jgi:hypothetical protein